MMTCAPSSRTPRLLIGEQFERIVVGVEGFDPAFTAMKQEADANLRLPLGASEVTALDQLLAQLVFAFLQRFDLRPRVSKQIGRGVGSDECSCPAPIERDER
jgi:hypothetical protein